MTIPGHAAAMDPLFESKLYTVLGCVLLSALLSQVYVFASPWVWRISQKMSTSTVDLAKRLYTIWYSFRVIIRDFRSGNYYRPWRPKNEVVVVSTKKHIAELSEAPELSQRAIYADMFGFKYNMNNLDHNEHKVVRSRLYGRVLQVNGPSQLAAIYPFLQARLEKSFAAESASGRRSDGCLSVRLASITRKVISHMMSLAFFGNEISSDPEFSSALLRYSADMVSSMAAFQVTPSFMAPLVHAIITKCGQAMHTLLNRLTPIMNPNCSEWTEPQYLKELTIVYNMMSLSEGNAYWTPEVLAQALLGIWFAASHQPWMNLDFVLLELCARPEYVQLLRKEIGDPSHLDYAKLEKLPLLDSFIKETVRVNPLDTLAIRRKALKPFTFSDGGPHVPKGSMACVSSYDLMHAEPQYPDANTFNGHRFLSSTTASAMRGSKFTDISEHFPVWGYGSLACPGRFHASLIMKMVLVYLISNFDLRLEDEKARRQFSWETFTMPYESTRVLLTPRTT